MYIFVHKRSNSSEYQAFYPTRSAPDKSYGTAKK